MTDKTWFLFLNIFFYIVFDWRACSTDLVLLSLMFQCVVFGLLVSLFFFVYPSKIVVGREKRKIVVFFGNDWTPYSTWDRTDGSDGNVNETLCKHRFHLWVSYKTRANWMELIRLYFYPSVCSWLQSVSVPAFPQPLLLGGDMYLFKRMRTMTNDIIKITYLQETLC